jgi:serine/threonine protein kinase
MFWHQYREIRTRNNGADTAVMATPGASMKTEANPVVEGRYVLEACVGAGNFAEIFRSLDSRTGDLVAVKRLRPEHALDPHALLLFSREGQIGSAVSHANVVKVRSFGTDGDTHYIVMDLVKGVSLRRRLDRSGRLAVPEALRIACALLQGLSAIHDTGYIHRDIKPHNILLEVGSIPKIIDFGIALGPDEPRRSTDGIALGTAAYIAPEQAAGEDIGPSSDLYSVGAVLFEMLTGQAPFPGDDPIEVMKQHLFEPPRDPRSINPQIPAALADIILRALAKEPGARFSSAGEMLASLTALSPSPANSSKSRGLRTALSRSKQAAPKPKRRASLALPNVRALPAFFSAVLLIVMFIVLVLGLVSSGGIDHSSSLLGASAATARATTMTRGTEGTEIAETTGVLPRVVTGWAAEAAVSNPTPTPAVLAPTIVPSPTPLPTNLAIYDRSLASGWDTSLSWGARLQLVSASATNFGSASLSYTATDGWAGLQLRNDDSVSTAPFNAIQFQVRSTKDGEPFAIYLRDAEFNNLSEPIPLSNYGGYPISTGWTTYTIPLADLNAIDVWLGSIVFHNWTAEAQPPIYLRNIQLINVP